MGEGERKEGCGKKESVFGSFGERQKAQRGLG
jgi:hypothetical protein